MFISVSRLLQLWALLHFISVPRSRITASFSGFLLWHCYTKLMVTKNKIKNTSRCVLYNRSLTRTVLLVMVGRVGTDSPSLGRSNTLALLYWVTLKKVQRGGVYVIQSQFIKKMFVPQPIKTVDRICGEREKTKCKSLWPQPCNVL